MAKRTEAIPEFNPDDPEWLELRLLGEIVMALARMSSEGRGRVFRYLKDKHSSEWPSDSY